MSKHYFTKITLSKDIGLNNGNINSLHNSQFRVFIPLSLLNVTDNQSKNVLCSYYSQPQEGTKS